MRYLIQGSLAAFLLLLAKPAVAVQTFNEDIEILGGTPGII